MFKKATLPAAVLALMLGGQSALAVESKPDPQEGLSLTLYPSNLAFVQDTRRFKLPDGGARIEVDGVPSEIIENSVFLGSDELVVKEWVFSSNLARLRAILDASVGSKVLIQLNSRYFGDSSQIRGVREAEVLGVDSEAIILRVSIPSHGGPDSWEISERVLALPIDDYLDMISFDDLPDGIHTHPRLLVEIYPRDKQSSGSAKGSIEYLTTGLDWSASYIARLDASGSKMDLSGWASLRNSTDARFENARVNLMAGDVARAGGRAVPMMKAQAMMDSAESLSSSPEAPSVGEVSSRQLYTFPSPVTLNPRERKQVSLMQASGVDVSKRYRSHLPLTHGGYELKATLFMAFENTTESGLGQPVPAGPVRVYQPDQNGRQQFVGESKLPDLDPGARHEIKIGRAFGVTVRNTTHHWDVDKRHLEGVLEFRNSEAEPVIHELVLDPVLTRNERRQHERLSLCQDAADGSDVGTRMSLTLPSTGGIEVVSAEHAGNERCTVSFKVDAGADVEVGYRYFGWQ
jgi:hypothetical protein